MDSSISEAIDGAINERVDPKYSGKGKKDKKDKKSYARNRGGQQIGNTRFYAKDMVGGEAQVFHDGDLKIGVTIGSDRVKVWSREAGIDIDVDHKPEQMASWRDFDEWPQSAHGQSHTNAAELPPGDLEVTFESDSSPPRGMMKEWTYGPVRGQLRFLHHRDDRGAFDNPWHAKVVAPDRMAGGRVQPVWSNSYDDRQMAEDALLQKINEVAQRVADRSSRNRR